MYITTSSGLRTENNWENIKYVKDKYDGIKLAFSLFLGRSCDLHCDKFRVIKPTRCTNFSIAKVNIIPYIRWSMTHSIRHFPRHQLINIPTATQLNQFEPDPTCKLCANRVSKHEIYYIVSIYRIFWNILLF